MEIISGNTSVKPTIKYAGKGAEFAIIYFKNIILTILTLGLYYPWAKVEILKYHYQSTALDGARFTFHATGMEVFKGFIKIYLMFIVLYGLLFYALQTQNQTLMFSSIGLFYLFIFLIVPFAIHGAVRYRSSRSSWKGIHFKYLGVRQEFFWLYLKGILLTVITLGIYGAWFQVDIRKYIFSHLRFGDVSFDFKGDGGELFWINLKFILLVYITLGIYSFWYYKNLWKFYTDNTVITQNGKKVNFKFNMQAGDVFELLVINFLLILFTLGLATPWVAVRTMKFFFRFLEIDGELDTNAIQQAKYDDYDDAAGDDLLDFFDFDLL
tara:strand:- start:701794 stop:702765 length:972 start_codon:yes stop_codon:yes gene_type:complete